MVKKHILEFQIDVYLKFGCISGCLLWTYATKRLEWVFFKSLKDKMKHRNDSQSYLHKNRMLNNPQIMCSCCVRDFLEYNVVYAGWAVSVNRHLFCTRERPWHPL